MGSRNRDSIRELPGRRLWLIDVLTEAKRKPAMVAFSTVDVHDTRAQLRAHRERTGEALSFTAFIIWCTARLVAHNPLFNTYRLGRRRLITFDDVDVFTPIERVNGERRTLVPHIVRAADKRSFREIHADIRAAQQGAGTPQEPSSFHEGAMSWMMSWIMKDSTLARRALVRTLRRDPRVRRRFSGTVIVTAPGLMAAGTSSCGFGPVSSTFAVQVGTIERQPRVVGDQVLPREALNLTLVADHEIVDGAEIARAIVELAGALRGGVPLQELS